MLFMMIEGLSYLIAQLCNFEFVGINSNLKIKVFFHYFSDDVSRLSLYFLHPI